MKKLIYVALSMAVAVVFSISGWADEYADTVVGFDRNVSNVVAPNFDETNVLGPEDGTGGTGWFNLGTAAYNGWIIISFDDNVLIPDGTGAADLTVWEASSNGNFNDLADVYVSDDGIDWEFVGQARDDPTGYPGGGPPYANTFDVDGFGFAFVKYVKLVNQSSGQGAKGFDTDAFEALNSLAAVTATDGCDIGGGGNDVDTVYAFSDGATIFVQLILCGEIDSKVKYRVHFDYTDQTNLDLDDIDEAPDTPDSDQTCLTTSDDTMKRSGNRDTGPGIITGEENMLWYQVDYAELAKNSSSLVSGDHVLISVDTQYKGNNDRAPNTESGDGCSKPQHLSEVVDITLE